MTTLVSRIAHNRRYCHCHRYATINKHARQIGIGVKAVFVAFLVLFGVAVARWIVTGFPGLTRSRYTQDQCGVCETVTPDCGNIGERRTTMSKEWNNMNKALERLNQVSGDFVAAINAAFDAMTTVIDSEECRTQEVEDKIYDLGRRVEDLEPSSTDTPAAVN